MGRNGLTSWFNSIKFGTKADTLHRLKNKLSKSEILSQIKFTINDVKNDIGL